MTTAQAYEALMKMINNIERHGNSNLDYKELLFFQSVERDITFPATMGKTLLFL